MNTTNKAFKEAAKGALEGKWGLTIGVFVIYLLITGAVQAWKNETSIISLIIGGPMSLGFSIFSLHLARGKTVTVNNLFDGFKNFGNSLVAYILVTLVVLVGFVLLIVPGIVWGIMYSQTFFIMADDPELSGIDSMRKSKKMMDGYKMRFFSLFLSFIGWILVGIITLGVGFLWVIPYMQITYAKFYDAIKEAEVDGKFLE